MLGHMHTSGGFFWVRVGGGSEILIYYLSLPPNMFTDKFLLKVKISTFGVPKDRIAEIFEDTSNTHLTRERVEIRYIKYTPNRGE